MGTRIAGHSALSMIEARRDAHEDRRPAHGAQKEAWMMSSVAIGRRFSSDGVWGRWTIAWLGGSALGIANGALRELFYKNSVGDLPAHYISTATLIVLLTLYIWMLERRWPLPSQDEAVRVGLTWLILTASFDFGFGHFVAGKSWAELARDYDLSAGRVWILILIWMAVAPTVMKKLRDRERQAR
jgi:hypothetical protein